MTAAEAERPTREGPSLFFLTGLPKTGTTWLLRMLNAVPGVCCRGEGLFFSHGLESPPSLYDGLTRGLRAWHEHIAHRKRNWLQLDDAIETRDRRNHLPRDLYQQTLARDVDAIARAAVRHFMTLHLDPRDDVRWLGDKTTILDGVGLRRLRRLFPESPAIVMTRDVSDFVVSLAFQHHRAQHLGTANAAISALGARDVRQIECFLEAGEGPAGAVPFLPADTLVALARIWRDVSHESDRLVAQAPERVRLVRYEDLFRAPVETLDDILSFLGVDAERDALARVVADHDHRRVRDGHDTRLKEHIRDPEPGGWRHYLSTTAKALVDDEAYARPGPHSSRSRARPAHEITDRSQPPR